MPRTLAFNLHWQRYEEWFVRNPFTYQSEVRAVRHLLPSCGKGIEIGTGSGRFAEPFGIKLGIEPSLPMLRLAQARGMQVVSAVAEQLPLQAGSFDYALMVTTICFVDDAETSFREVVRILKRSGCFVIGFVDRNSPLGSIYEQQKRNNVFYQDATFYSADEVLDLLEMTRFTDARVIQTVFGEVKQIRAVQGFKSGHGEGGFVVIRASRE